MSQRTPVIGIDLVRVDEVADAIEEFGDRYVQRVYTPDEIRYCASAPATRAERFAARFAAKEAVLKLLDAPDQGIDLRSIEVRRAPGGACTLRLAGRARELAGRARLRDLALSLTHEGGFAAAIVVGSRPASHS